MLLYILVVIQFRIRDAWFDLFYLVVRYVELGTQSESCFLHSGTFNFTASHIAAFHSAFLLRFPSNQRVTTGLKLTRRGRVAFHSGMGW